MPFANATMMVWRRQSLPSAQSIAVVPPGVVGKSVTYHRQIMRIIPQMARRMRLAKEGKLVIDSRLFSSANSPPEGSRQSPIVPVNVQTFLRVKGVEVGRLVAARTRSSSTAFYRSQNPDVAQAGIEPLCCITWCTAALRKDVIRTRSSTPRSMGAKTPTSAQAGIDPLLHYLAHGSLGRT